MSDGSAKGSRRRRGRRASEPYADFYTSYYGLDEPAGPPTRHRAAASRTGAALVAGLSALMRRKVVVILTLGLSAVLVLAVGVMASATRTGSDTNHLPNLVDTTGSPTDQGGAVVPIAGGTTTHPAPSPSGSTKASSSPVISTPGNIPVYAPPPAVAGPGTTQAAAPPPSSQHTSTTAAPPPSTHQAPPPTSTHTTSTPPPPPPPTSSSPTPTPTPSPTKKCIIPDPLHPGKCLLAGT